MTPVRVTCGSTFYPSSDPCRQNIKITPKASKPHDRENNASTQLGHSRRLLSHRPRASLRWHSHLRPDVQQRLLLRVNPHSLCLLQAGLKRVHDLRFRSDLWAAVEQKQQERLWLKKGTEEVRYDNSRGWWYTFQPNHWSLTIESQPLHLNYYNFNHCISTITMYLNHCSPNITSQPLYINLSISHIVSHALHLNHCISAIVYQPLHTDHCISTITH